AAILLRPPLTGCDHADSLASGRTGSDTDQKDEEAEQRVRELRHCDECCDDRVRDHDREPHQTTARARTETVAEHRQGKVQHHSDAEVSTDDEAPRSRREVELVDDDSTEVVDHRERHDVQGPREPGVGQGQPALAGHGPRDERDLAPNTCSEFRSLQCVLILRHWKIYFREADSSLTWRSDATAPGVPGLNWALQGGPQPARLRATWITRGA